MPDNSRNRGDSGGVDLAQGFSAMTRSNEQIAASIQTLTANMQTQAQAQMDMQRRFSDRPLPRASMPVGQMVSNIRNPEAMLQGAGDTVRQHLMPAQVSPPGLTGSLGPEKLDQFIKSMPGVNAFFNATDAVMGQVNKSNVYRRMEGGSLHDTIGERIAQEQYRFQSFGVMGQEESQAAFQGATRLGYNDTRRQGVNRQDAVDYIYDAKKQRGQSVEDSLDQIALKGESASVTLKSLSDAMESVTETARSAGVNVQQATAGLSALIDRGIRSGKGAGSVGMGQAIMETNLRMGKDYASRANSNGMYTPEMEYRAAAMSGMTQHQLRTMTRHDPASAAKVFGKVTDQAMSSAGITPAMKSWIQARIAQLDGPLDDTSSIDIASDFLDQFPELNDNVLVGQLESLAGQHFDGDSELAARWVVNQVGGNTIQANAAKNVIQAGKMNASGKLSDGTQAKDAATSIDEFASKATSSLLSGNRTSQAAQDYIDHVKASPDDRDRVAEALLGNEALIGTEGDNAMVEVKAKGGRKIVSLAEARKNFPNQVSSGMVKFVKGPDSIKGKTVQDIVGFGTGETAASKAEEAKAASEGSLTSADWKRKYGDPDNPDKKATSGNFTLSLTTEAQRLLKVVDAPGAKNASAQQAGVPPTPGNGNGSRSTSVTWDPTHG